MNPVADAVDHGPEKLQVAFPATPTFTRIGRVTVVGLALRLGLDVSTVERLRAAVDLAVSALLGPGRITARASWTADELTVSLDNPDASIDDPNPLTDELADLVGSVSVEASQINLTLPTAASVD